MRRINGDILIYILQELCDLDDTKMGEKLKVDRTSVGTWRRRAQNANLRPTKRWSSNWNRDTMTNLFQDCLQKSYKGNHKSMVQGCLEVLKTLSVDGKGLQDEYMKNSGSSDINAVEFFRFLVVQAKNCYDDDTRTPYSVDRNFGHCVNNQNPCMTTAESKEQTVSAGRPRYYELPAETQPAFRFGKATVSSMPKAFLDAYLQKLPTLPQKTAGFISDLMYDTCPAAFLGRDNELARLDSFACDERPLLWWAITGSAGKGKTRLAHEFLKQLSNDDQWLTRTVNWRAFVSDFSEIGMCLSPEPTKLFIVIDYVFAYEKEIADWVEWLSSHTTDVHKIRILLIEREDQKIDPSGQIMRAPWEELFSAVPQDPMLMIRLKYARENLNLNRAKISSEDAKAIVRSYCKKRNMPIAPGKIDAIVLVAEKSSNGVINPLQLLLLTEYYATASHGAVSVDIFQSALESIVTKELITLRRLFNIEYHEQDAFDCILLYATIIGSISLHSELFQELVLCDPAALKNVLAKMEASRKCERGQDGAYYLRGIQPDLIGEHFVHTFFSAHSDNRVSCIVQCIDKRNHYELSRFLLRYITDYRNQIITQDRLDIFSEYLPDKNTSFIVHDSVGNEVICDILFTFDSEENGKSYIVYTDKTRDADGKTQVYASIYDPATANSKLWPIQTEKEWGIIEIILSVIQNAIQEYGADIDSDVLTERIEERIQAEYGDA